MPILQEVATLDDNDEDDDIIEIGEGDSDVVSIHSGGLSEEEIVSSI